jgi:predicted small lipoprotein YifL
MRTLFSALLLTVMLSACGQKGPLYMPDKPAAQPVISGSGTGKNARQRRLGETLSLFS